MKLQPCPFCGCGKIRQKTHTPAVLCQRCGATAANIDAWNTRPQLAKLREENRELREDNQRLREELRGYEEIARTYGFVSGSLQVFLRTNLRYGKQLEGE